MLQLRSCVMVMLSAQLLYLIPLFAQPGKATIQQKETLKPNVIFILTDDQRWDAIGYSGNKLIHTPEMDKLARSGAYFENAFSSTPICAGSRASILTGLYERTHGYNFQTGAIRAEYMHSAYPVLLRQAGYYTGFYGKLGVNCGDKDKLFDAFEDYDRNNNFSDRRGYFYKTLGKDTVHLTRYTGQKALDFIDGAPPGKPFCLSLSFSAPHAHDPAPDQYFCQEETDQLLRDVTIPGPELSEDRYFNALPEMVKSGFNRLRWTWRFDTPEKYQHSIKGYYRMISGIDLEISKIRQRLVDKGLDRNTVIILLGDNGYFLGERQLAGKWLLYENSIRVPLIIFDPRVNAHRNVSEMALNLDVPATILDIAGVARPTAWHGQSLLPIVSGIKSSLHRDTVLIEHLWEFDNIPPSEGMRTSEWKYFRYVNNKSIEQLFNLSRDPKEINNLSRKKQYEEILIGLRKATETLIKQYKDPLAGIPSGLMVEFIRRPGRVSLNDPVPEYGWIVPVESVFQLAYQILVASSRANLDHNIGDIWNSGQVRTSKSFNITHQGLPLIPGQTYYWKVRIWDQHNRLGNYSDWQSFKMGQPGPGIATPEIFQADTIRPRSFVQQNDNSCFVDFGRDAFAGLLLNYESGSSDTLVVRIGEQLENNAINRNPEGHIRYQEIKVPVRPGRQKYAVQIRPDERNTKPGAIALPDSFPVLMPFRYCEIENAKAKLTADDVIQLAYHSYFDDSESYFSSSDTILNHIWKLCKYSMKATSFAGVYIDGDRERIPYEADAYINQLSHYASDREYALARRSIEYFMDHPTWPTEWQLHVAMLFYEDYMYTGNSELVEKYYDALKHKTLMELSRPDGLISSSSKKATKEFMQSLGFKDPGATLRDIVDWPPAQKDTNWKLFTEEGERDGYVFTPINTVVNCFYYRNMEIMAEFARILSKPDDEEDFLFRAMQVRRSINEKLFERNTGAYVDGEGTGHSSLHANMMALAFNIVPESRVKTVVNFIKTRGMACSVYGAQYLMQALFNAGESDYALALMTATHDRSWWNMIEAGSTITMEAWDMKYKPNADWNHAWGAVPANVIARNLWGIIPETPGGRILRIRPQLGTLSYSAVKVPFITGAVAASYQRSGRNQEFMFELPGNVSAELELDYGPDDMVLLNGHTVNLAFGSIRLAPGMNRVELKINSF